MSKKKSSKKSKEDGKKESKKENKNGGGEKEADQEGDDDSSASAVTVNGTMTKENQKRNRPQFLGETSKRLEIPDVLFPSSYSPSVHVSASKRLCGLRNELVALFLS